MKSLIATFLMLVTFAAESQSLAGEWTTSDKRSTYYFFFHRNKYIALKLPLKQKKISPKNIFLYDLVYLPRRRVYKGKKISGHSRNKKVVLCFDQHNADLLVIKFREKKLVTIVLLKDPIKNKPGK